MEVGYGFLEWTVLSRNIGLREQTSYIVQEPPPGMD
jgi:hypothetical protein